VYKDEKLQAKVEKVLGHIAWLLEETQKPVEASQNGVKKGKVNKRSCDKIELES
jgi:hypothetical protein